MRVVTKQKIMRKKDEDTPFLPEVWSDEPLSFSLFKKLADSDTGYLHRLFLRGPTLGSVLSCGLFFFVWFLVLPATVPLS